MDNWCSRDLNSKVKAKQREVGWGERALRESLCAHDAKARNWDWK